MMIAATQRSSRKIATLKATAPAVLESLEERKLLSMWTYSGSSISEITDFSVYASARMGDNGDPWGVAGVVTGTETEETGWATREWDNNLANGLDSGLIDFTFTVDMSAGFMSWAVDGADTITCYDNFGAGISQVYVHAGVLTSGMAFTFSSLSLRFYSGTTLIDTETISSGPVANTLGAQTSDPAESLAVVTPDASGCDKVIITGSFRLQAAQGVYPGATDIFGNIYILANA